MRIRFVLFELKRITLGEFMEDLAIGDHISSAIGID